MAKKKEKISKLAIDKKEVKSETIPNPITLGGLQEIGLTKLSPIEIPRLLFMHPALPRGIEIKSNRMITRVDSNLLGNILPNTLNDNELDELNLDNDSPVKNEDDLDQIRKEAASYCKHILQNSGGPLFIKKMASGAYRFGTSFSVLQTNRAEDKVLKFEYQHEIFFGPARYPTDIKDDSKWDNVPKDKRGALAGKMKIDPKTKDISKYSQLTKKYPNTKENNLVPGDVFVNTITHPGLKNSRPGELVAVGKEFDDDQVIKLAFDTLGDEPLGIPLAQFLQLTITYLLDMEKAGAQTMVNFGFNKWKATTPFKDGKKMKQFGKSLSNLQKDSVIVLPNGVTLENIAPGPTDFDKVHPIYMQLVAIRLGIPMPLLVQSGTETNKATIESMKEDMYEDFRADELVVENVITDGFFKACQIKWPLFTVKDLNAIAPKFSFKKPPENLDREMDLALKFSLMFRNFSTSAREWFEAGGDKKVIDAIGEKMNLILQKSILKDKLDLEEHGIKLIETPLKNKTKEEVEKEEDGGS